MTWSRWARKTLALFAVLASSAHAPARAAAPATMSCASPRLPPAILDGTAARSGANPLRIVEVREAALTLRLAVASQESERMVGLMCVTRLRPQTGMLFVFPTDDEHEFWMKRTLVSLDMVWVGGDGTVRGVAADVPASTLDTPDDRVALRGGRGRYVIELRAGEAAADGIVPGAHLAIPPLTAS
jgi:uncharacterized membrane protein (UPF0127 family)